jgi:serine phosphatase RsbU (regulator of sigma subunit)
VGLSNILVVLYAGPLSVIGFVWLAGATDLSVFARFWLPLSIIFVFVYALRRLDFLTFFEIEPGLFGSFGGAFDDICIWPAALLFGPTAIWLFVFWRSVQLVRELRASDVAEQRWSVIREYLLEGGGNTFAALVALAVYVRLGGVHPPSQVSLQTFVPAAYATAVRFLLPVAVGAPYLAYVASSSAIGLEGESRRRFFRFSLLATSWTLLVAPFALFTAGIYVEVGLIGFVFLVSGALLASVLSHRMSRAIERSNERTRELESLDRLSRAILSGPPDASRLSQQLEEHASNMFAFCITDIRLFPGNMLLHAPSYSEPVDDVVWEWLQATGETLASPAGRELPWGGRPKSRGLVLVPILSHESAAVIGGIALRRAVSPRDVTDIVPAAQSLAAQIASALHGAKVYEETLEHMRTEEELAVAAEMQASLMPASMPEIPGWEFRAIIDSAREASGDFIDLIPVSDGRWGFLVADVSGKGIGAALYMAVVRTLIRTYARENADTPDRVMAEVNRRVLEDTSNEAFVTAFYAVLDPPTGDLVYCNAGHNPPYLFRGDGDGRSEELSSTGIPVGMLEEARWESSRARIAPGDRLLIYTDGVTDARNENEEPFGEKRLLTVAREHLKATPLEMRTAVFDEIKRFVGDAQQLDDITLLVMARQ